MKLRDLFVSIGFDVDDKALGDLDRGLQKTKTLILAVGAAAIASAGMLYKMAKSVADAGDKAAKTAGRMGINLELLQEYQYAAQLAGMSVQELNMNMEQFIRRAAETADGSGESQAAYKELGIAVKDVNGQVKSSDQLLAEVADRFAEIKDGSVKVRLAYDLFGRSGIGMINMLNQGSAAIAAQREEARRLGVVLSEKTARDAEKFTDDLLRAKSVIIGIKNEVGARLLPVMIDLLVQFRQWAMYHREIISAGVQKVMRGAIALMRILYKIGRGVVVVMSEVVELFGGLERAARVAGWAIGLFIGSQALSAIGSLVMGVGKLTGAFGLLGNVAMLANIKAAAIPVLIGAAVALLILFWQDVISFFQGKDSVLGTLIEAFEKRLPRAFKAMETAFSILKEILSGHWVVHAKEAIAPFFEWLLEKFRPIVETVQTLTGKGFRSRFDNAIYSAADALGLGVSGGTVRYYKVPKYNNVRVNAPVTVNVPEGTPPESVAGAVQKGVSDGLSRMLRDTSLETEPQVEN